MLQVEKVFGCVGLEKGANITGWIMVAISFFGIGVHSWVIAVTQASMYDFWNRGELPEWYSIILLSSFFILYFLLLLLSSVLLVIRTKKRETTILMPFMFLMVIGVFFYVAILLSDHRLAFVNFIAILAAAINIYFFICIHSLYTQIKKEQAAIHLAQTYLQNGVLNYAQKYHNSDHQQPPLATIDRDQTAAI